MSSIYISMPSMNDKELIPSIKSCLSQISRDNTVNIGVAFSTFLKETNIDYFIDNLSKFDNVKFKHFTEEESLGVAAARKNAYSFYDGEDYFLQIDAHSFFKKNWDIELIDTFKKCQSVYGKSILTCYPPPYQYTNGQRKLLLGWSTITTAVKEGVLSDVRFDDDNKYFWDFLPLWESPHRKFFYDDYEEILKVSAGFLFGDKTFAENYLEYIPYNYFFFEEEIVMTMEILSHGYNLIAPANIPVAHIYSTDLDDGSMREGIKPKVLYANENLIKNNFYNYCDLNKDKIVLLNNRLNIDMFSILNKSKARLNKC